jgi:hypothetical protein
MFYTGDWNCNPKLKNLAAVAWFGSILTHSLTRQVIFHDAEVDSVWKKTWQKLHHRFFFIILLLLLTEKCLFL